MSSISRSFFNLLLLVFPEVSKYFRNRRFQVSNFNFFPSFVAKPLIQFLKSIMGILIVLEVTWHFDSFSTSFLQNSFLYKKACTRKYQDMQNIKNIKKVLRLSSSSSRSELPKCSWILFYHVPLHQKITRIRGCQGEGAEEKAKILWHIGDASQRISSWTYGKRLVAFNNHTTLTTSFPSRLPVLHPRCKKTTFQEKSWSWIEPRRVC